MNNAVDVRHLHETVLGNDATITSALCELAREVDVRAKAHQIEAAMSCTIEKMNDHLARADELQSIHSLVVNFAAKRLAEVGE